MLSFAGQSAEPSLLWAAVPSSVLNIPATLRSGQCFRWQTAANGDWLGTVADTAIRLRPAQSGFWWQTYPQAQQWERVSRYFALDVELSTLAEEWSVREPRLSSALTRHVGLRILRQEPAEAFFAFVCASCNTITKITRSVQALAARYGTPITTLEGIPLFRFPTAEQIAEADEAVLRAMLWGYRAPRLRDLARHAAGQGAGWWEHLRGLSYANAHRELTALHGIGAKLADCICLFGLGHDDAVPVDTHIWQAVLRLYHPEWQRRTLTPSLYRAVGDLLRERFGNYAGWAQQYLFLEEILPDTPPPPGNSDTMNHTVNEEGLVCNFTTP